MNADFITVYFVATQRNKEVSNCQRREEQAYFKTFRVPTLSDAINRVPTGQPQGIAPTERRIEVLLCPSSTDRYLFLQPPCIF